MDVSKIFSKSPEQGEIIPAEPQSKTILKTQKNTVQEVEPTETEETEEWVTPEEVTEILAQPIQDWVAMTSPFFPVHPLYQIYNRLVQEVIALRDKKGKDYGSQKDPFANVRGAQEFGVQPWIGAANSANDCMTRIKQYARTGSLENESVRDSMLDLVNYGLIMATLWEEANGEN